MTEQQIIEKIETMCIESLSPEKFEMWEEVKKWLQTNRNLNES